MTDRGEKKKKSFWAPKHIAYVKGFPYTATMEEIRDFFKDCGKITSIVEQLDERSKKWTGCLYVRFSQESDMNKAIALTRSIWQGTGGDGKRYLNITKHNTKHEAKEKNKQAKETQKQAEERTRAGSVDATAAPTEALDPVEVAAATADNETAAVSSSTVEYKIVIGNLSENVVDKDIKGCLLAPMAHVAANTTNFVLPPAALAIAGAPDLSTLNIPEGCGIKNSQIKSVRIARDIDTKKCRGFCHIEFNDEKALATALLLNEKVYIGTQLVTIRIPSKDKAKKEKKEKNDRPDKKEAKATRKVMKGDSYLYDENDEVEVIARSREHDKKRRKVSKETPTEDEEHW
jgi:RNA recognition motif-containing protein